MDVQVGFRLPISLESPPSHECDHQRVLEVNVIYTDVPGTLAALRKAGQLAANLRARIQLIVPQVVPYPLPLSRSSVPREFLERRFHTLAEGLHVDTHVQICLCRDREQLLAEALPPRSLIVIGGRKRWWSTAEQALASRLGRGGHEVVYAEVRSLLKKVQKPLPLGAARNRRSERTATYRAATKGSGVLQRVFQQVLKWSTLA